mmetsp:Transcript_63592/g.201109  ORF Transcript_63592/g.201109 Transcript_63592/m.201109 type:complete len:286 (-) Transcript_63592:1146-2003(-)
MADSGSTCARLRWFSSSEILDIFISLRASSTSLCPTLSLSRSLASASLSRRIESSVRAVVYPVGRSLPASSARISAYTLATYSVISTAMLGTYERATATYERITSGANGSKSRSGARRWRWTCTTCCASAVSASDSGLSRMSQRRSKRERRAAGSAMFSDGVLLRFHREKAGLAAASTAVRAFREVVMPALAMDTVCCSITSWMAVRSLSSILSNSSMQQMPLSASTSAPPSSTNSLVTGSRVTAAVKPTPLDPLPVVYTPRGATEAMCLRSCDLATPGSPMRQM